VKIWAFTVAIVTGWRGFKIWKGWFLKYQTKHVYFMKKTKLTLHFRQLWLCVFSRNYCTGNIIHHCLFDWEYKIILRLAMILRVHDSLINIDQLGLMKPYTPSSCVRLIDRAWCAWSGMTFGSLSVIFPSDLIFKLCTLIPGLLTMFSFFILHPVSHSFLVDI
jgi:hypothetical protein